MSIQFLTLEDRESLLKGERIYKEEKKGLKIFYEYQILLDFRNKEPFLLIDIFYPTHYASERYTISELNKYFSSLEKNSA